MRFLLLLPLLAAAAVAAQPAPPAGPFLRQWAAEVRAALESVEAVTYRERFWQEVDGPFATRSLGTESVVTRRPGSDPQRRLLRAEVEGRPVPPPTLLRTERRLRRALGADYRLVRRALELPLEAFRLFEPTGPLVPTTLDGRPAWRLDAVARDSDLPVERAALWFAPEPRRPTLLRSRVVLSGRAGTSAVVETAYDAAGGLPLLRRRTVEARLQQRRRIRTFTVLVTAEVTVDQVEIERR
ncbi:MAG: hypothetical protein R3362_04580 [Rhodothermales bacterium]|nr:hypothetical protein [Rhodothermales bacterium]